MTVPGLASERLDWPAMDRRRFLVTSLAGALAAPVGAEAQGTGKIPRIGYLSPLSHSADAAQWKAFREGLRTLGYIEGQNVLIEVRYADGGLERLRALAAELVRLNVDVIVASPTPAVRAAHQATRTIPIVMISGDPVGEGFVVGLARPEGNITGHSTAVAEIATKRLEFLKAIVPRLARVAHLTTREVARSVVTQTEAAGRALGVQIITTAVQTASEMDRAFWAMPGAHIAGVIVSLSLRPYWREVLDRARQSQLPTVSGPREFVEAGGLLAYGPHYPELFQHAATYVDRILKGARPADLPIEQATKFELVINLKTAKALGLTIPPSLLTRADQIIE